MNIKKTLDADGFADLGEFHRKATTAEVAHLIGAELGIRPWGLPELLTVNAATAKPKNTYAGNYGLGALPLHTDLAHWYVPPRYLMLRCVVADPTVATLVIHHREALRNVPDAIIDRALFRPRRRLEGQMFLLRLRQRGIFRWDQLFLNPDNEEARQIRLALIDNQLSYRTKTIILDKPGRTILIENWTTLHGRSAVDGSSSGRRIERVYFSGEEYGE